MALMSTGAALPATAQTVTSPDYAQAPWWMRQPIIASTGLVSTDLRANRASFSASFRSIQRTAQEANRASAEQVRGIARALAAFGPERVQVETGFNTQPIYAQYRDREGNLVDNERADRIERYETSAELTIRVRDIRLLENAYAAVLASSPTSVDSVSFELDPDNETNTRLFGLAVQDAARRARLAAEATGATLGAVRLIDPTGRACETDVLVAGAPRSFDQPGVFAQNVPPPPPPPALAEGEVESIVVTGSRIRGERPTPEDLRVPLQPPLTRLQARACVVYALGG